MRQPASESCSLDRMLIYGLGECASSLVMNSIFAFAILYYTKALRLDPSWAGIAMSVSVLWEAITEPVVGHLSDHTRGRWGRRHPYMVGGGLLMAGCSYLMWAVPAGLQASQWSLFWYLVVVNLALRAGLSLFCIPYMALGFEICTDYQGRSRIQSIRQIFNMAANLAGPALAWSLFFQDHGGVHGTSVPGNYFRMGLVFSLATLLFVLLVVAGTIDRHKAMGGEPLRTHRGADDNFLPNLKQILAEPNIRCTLLFALVIGTGTLWMSALQVFVYDDLMCFTPHQKTVAHSGTMVGWAIGAFLSVGLARRFDKKGSVVVGGLIGFGANLCLVLLFLTGILPPDAVLKVGGVNFAVGLWSFVVFHASYWLGVGIMMPSATAMIADVSEENRLQTGRERDGSYAAVFSLTNRLACALGMATSGLGLHLIGYRTTLAAEASHRSPEAIWRLGFASFAVGAGMCLAALLPILKYRLTRQRLEAMRAVRVLPSESIRAVG